MPEQIGSGSGNCPLAIARCRLPVAYFFPRTRYRRTPSMGCGPDRRAVKLAPRFSAASDLHLGDLLDREGQPWAGLDEAPDHVDDVAQAAVVLLEQRARVLEEARAVERHGGVARHGDGLARIAALEHVVDGNFVLALLHHAL